MACGTTVNLRNPQQPHPYIDCRPYPTPTKLDLTRQKLIKPISQVEHWDLTIADYLAVYLLNKKLIAYQEETKVIAGYFVICLTNFNTSVAEKNKVIGVNNAKEKELLNRKPSKWQFWK